MATERPFSAPRRAPPTVPAVRPSGGQLWQVPVFVAGLLALLGVWLARPLWYDPDARRLARELAEARGILDHWGAAVNGVPALLTDALARTDRFPGRAGEAHLLRGSAYIRLAEQTSGDRADAFWRLARSDLEQAEQDGVPEPDHNRLRYRLAKTWYHTGGDRQRVLDYLLPTVNAGADDRAEAYALLTQVYLDRNELYLARLANETLLQLPFRDENALVPANAKLRRGQLLLALNQRDEARNALEAIRPGVPPAILFQARFLLARSYQEDGTWKKACPLWQALAGDHQATPPEAAQIAYALGWCYWNLERPAEAARAWQRAVAYGGEEGQAAQLRLANARLVAGDIKTAVELYQTALRQVKSGADYHNAALSLAQLQELLRAGCAACQKRGDFASAEQLAGLHAAFAPPGPAQLLLGQVAEAGARAEDEQARRARDPAEAKRLEKTAADHHRQAGAAFEAAATGAGPTDQADWLWHAGDNYRRGRAYEHVVPVLQRFVKLPAATERRSEAWYRLGQAYQVLHQEAQAQDCYKGCITEGPSSFAFRARYELARIAQAKGHLEDAEQMLLQILGLTGIDADPEVKEKTLLALAEILFCRQEYEQAAIRFQEALEDYHPYPGAMQARYQLAECYRRQAEAEAQEDSPSEQNWTEVGYLRRHTHMLLGRAVSNLQKLKDDLEAQQKAAPLTEADARLLRQTLFALAACYFQRGEYENAIDLYTTLKDRYRGEVDGILALKGLWWCYATPVRPPGQKSELDLAIITLQEACRQLRELELDPSKFHNRPDGETRETLKAWISDAEKLLSQYRAK